MLRSKSEVIIANLLHERAIPFRYEQPLFAGDRTFVSSKSAILVTHHIGEAIAMADRVLVLSARPASVRALHVIDLPKAGRDPVALRTDLAFQTYFARIWADLEMPTATL
jgi:ABC-type nitrate/sulfonate/bicarbonate transport system ATPase subunit